MSNRLMAIDPSINACGWAYFVRGHLQEAGLWCPSGQGPSRMLDPPKMPGLKAAVVSEWPQIYRHTRNPDDQLWMPAIVGTICRHLSASDIILYRPRQWKGQRTKKATEMGCRDVMDTDEIKKVMKSCSPSLRHNVWDAVGIGLYHLRRAPWRK